jgi:hypothetical protein
VSRYADAGMNLPTWGISAAIPINSSRMSYRLVAIATITKTARAKIMVATAAFTVSFMASPFLRLTAVHERQRRHTQPITGEESCQLQSKRTYSPNTPMIQNILTNVSVVIVHNRLIVIARSASNEAISEMQGKGE